MESAFGEIITFYSYKGGVGRSMAVANIACILAQKQSVNGNVLMIDWDLEAPGLHQFFHGKFENPNGMSGDLPSGQLGLIDLFYELRNRLEKSESQNSTPEDIFAEIDIQKYITKINYPLMFFMPAGKFEDGSYSVRVNEFDWEDFFNKFPSIITQFAQYLRKKFKYVLIDSRTGYTDISGICTSIMPEKLVTVFTPNRQSLSGVVEMIRRAIEYRKQSDDLRPLIIFPLPSRIENAENDLQRNWRFGNAQRRIKGYQAQLESILKDVYSLQECDLTKYFDEYQLQYKPKYSYGEEIAVLSERSEDRLSLARSFENFSEMIIGDVSPWKDSITVPDMEQGKRGVDLDRVSEPTRRIILRSSMILLGTFVLALLYFLGLPSIQSQQFLSTLFSSNYFGIVVTIFISIDLIWINRWKSVLYRINKLIIKPWIFEEDKEPDNPPLFPRRLLEQLAMVGRNTESDARLKEEDVFRNDALSAWTRNIQDLVFDREYPFRTLGYILAFGLFVFFLIADAITIANTLVLMGLISANLPPLLARLEYAILGGAVLTAVIGVWMLVELAGKGELIKVEGLTITQKRILRFFASVITIFAFFVMLALAVQRMISLGYVNASPASTIVISFALYGVLAINNSLSAALTFQPAASGLLVLVYVLFLVFPIWAFITDILCRVIYIILDAALWALLTPIIAIPYGISRIIGLFR